MTTLVHCSSHCFLAHLVVHLIFAHLGTSVGCNVALLSATEVRVPFCCPVRKGQQEGDYMKRQKDVRKPTSTEAV